MKRFQNIRHKLSVLSLSLSLIAPANNAFADTIVTMYTSLGNIDIELFDHNANDPNSPNITVTNFLSYVNSGAYTNSFIHRSIPGFIVQGGGFTWDTVNNKGYNTIATHAPIVNEYHAANANITGTIAMAKVGGNPNSATDQWFFNLADNRSNLDNQNGGFTVFGKVINNGMDVVNAIAALPVVNADGGGTFSNLPLKSLTGGYNTQNLVIISNVAVTGNIQVVPIPSLVWLYGVFALGGIRLLKKRQAV